MKTKLKGSGFSRALLKMNMPPLILLTLVITAFSTVRLAHSMNVETQTGLVNLCHAIATLYDTVYEGSYHAVDRDGSVYMMKGEHLLNGDFSIIDSIKEKTGVDVTIFYQDTRIITTIQSDEGVRAVGTKVDDTVIEDVLKGGQPHFYSGVMVEGVRYFSYYEPLYASDGTCIGMIFLGKPSKEVESMVYGSIRPIIIFCIITMLIVCLITVRFSNKLVAAIRRTESFLETVAEGELHTKIDADILRRKDELGEMGRYLIKMQKSLQNLVERDILTGLYNRRSGEKLLRRTYESCQRDGIPFCVVIGDIDYFKRVNDTYGHECGDITLVKTADTIRKHMQKRGLAARWGGEEILLIYNNMRLNAAVSCVKELMEDIRSQQIEYGDATFNITMTFGVAEGNDDKIEHIIRNADTKLYEGKNNGRNCVVYE